MCCIDVFDDKERRGNEEDGEAERLGRREEGAWLVGGAGGVGCGLWR